MTSPHPQDSSAFPLPHPMAPQPAYPHPTAPPAGSFGPPLPGAVPLSPTLVAPPLTCRLCGALPAAFATFRAHQGVLMWMRFSRMDGPFCRTCGLAIYREVTSSTMWQGWWSPLSLVLFTPGTLIINRFTLAHINKLPAPIPGQPGRQLLPGAPVLRRVSSLAAVLPLLWAIWVASHILSDLTS
ncbi:hypothetical protein ACWCPS_19575 [Streptomyces mauvecolor]